MNWSHLIRQTHRWLAAAFVASIIIYMIMMSRGPVPGWLNAFPLGTLFLMLATGVYLFVLPYVTKRRVAA